MPKGFQAMKPRTEPKAINKPRAPLIPYSTRFNPPAPHPSRSAPNSAPNRPGIASWEGRNASNEEESGNDRAGGEMDRRKFVTAVGAAVGSSLIASERAGAESAPQMLRLSRNGW